MNFTPQSDQTTHGSISMSHVHSCIHRGELFGARTILSLPGGISVSVLLQVPAGWMVHWLYNFYSYGLGGFRVRVYDDPDITNPGILLPDMINRHRGVVQNQHPIIYPDGVTHYVFPTLADPGAIWADWTMAAGTFHAMTRPEDEIVFGSPTGVARWHHIMFTAPGLAQTDVVISIILYFVPFIDLWRVT